MKKYILIIMFLILLLVTYIFYIYENSKLNTFKKINLEVVEQTKNYKIIALKNEEITKYYYWILDNTNNTIYKSSSYKMPNLSYYSNNIIQLHLGSGNVSQYQFFDTKNSITSPIYENPTLIDNEKIMYMTFENNKIKLIVRDLFDELKLYRKYERDFSPVATAHNDLINAKFIDVNKLQITYLSGKDFIEVTEILNLDIKNRIRYT